MTESKKETEQDKATANVLAELRKAGGGLINRNDAVKREGTQYVIPANATLGSAAKFLKELEKEQDEITSFAHAFHARPWDGAHCAYKALQEVFGAVRTKGTMGFFGPNPPLMLDVPVGVDETVQVPWGTFTLPGLPGCAVTFHEVPDEDKGVLFGVMVDGPKKFASEIEGLFRVIEEACREYSIYKGKAIEGGHQPEFISVDIDPDRVVYSGDVMVQLEANVWSVIEDAELQKAAGLPLKRSVLLHGNYGTGKSLFLGLTAKRATDNGWTFIRCRPGKDDYREVLQTAALYAPAVVAFEDVDTLASSDSSATDVAKLLDMFDGITQKGIPVIALLTTNHPDRIHKGMVRPGRLDAVIEIGTLDATGIERLIRSLVPADMLAPDVEFTLVADAMGEYMPAFIKEAADRAIRYAISRSQRQNADVSANGSVTKRKVTIDTEDLVNAANGLRPQLELMNEAKDHVGYQPPLDRTMRKLMGEAVHGLLSGGNVRVRDLEVLDRDE